jgi:hypothetical protein
MRADATVDTRARTTRLFGLAVLAVVVAVALTRLEYPFASDQAFATIVARAMRHGDVLYRDVWDVRQPGTFVFYLLGGSLFGFDELGVHLFEGLYFLAFAIVLQRTLRDRFDHPLLAAAAPLFVIVPYWAAAGHTELTEPEALIGFPLYVACWGLCDAGTRIPSSARLWVTGLAGVAVVAFKLVYLPIVLVVWAIPIVDVTRQIGFPAMVRRLRWLFAGFGIPVVVGFVYFAAYGLLSEVYWTFVLFPPKQRALDQRDFDRLATCLRYLVRYFAWTVPLVVVALTSRRVRADRLAQALCVWLAFGFLLLLAQTWGTYQFQLLIVPLGLLAAFGADRLLTQLRAAPPDRRAAWYSVAALAALLALLPLRVLAGTTARFAQDEFTLTASGRTAYQDRYNPTYPRARDTVAFLRAPGSEPGPIHVIGEAELQYFSGRALAGPVSGQTPEQLDGRLWRRTRDELRDVRPPYLFFDDDFVGLMRERSPETLAQIRHDFCRFRRAPNGWWYANRAYGDCAGSL